MTARKRPKAASPRPDAGRDMNDAARDGVPPAAIADAIDNAAEVLPGPGPGDAPPPVPPPEPQDDDGGYAGRPGEVDMDRCPIQFLGKDRRHFYIADVEGGLQTVSRFSPDVIERLFFGDLTWLMDSFGYFDGPPPKGREPYRAPHFRAFAMAQCARAGWFDPGQHIRGPGCWPEGAEPDLAGNLVLHRGREVWHITRAEDGAGMRWQRHRPGCRIGQYVYPRTDGVGVSLADAPLTDAQYEDLLRLIARIPWADPQRDGVIYLGGICLSFLTGAVPHRPGFFVTSAFGGGKSTISRLAALLTDGRYLRNYSEAAIRDDAVERRSASLIVIDEAEKKAGPDSQEKILPIVEIARHAYDWAGGTFGRAGGGSTGIIHANFMFFGIDPPHMDNQDISRFPTLRLKPLEAGPEEILDFEGHKQRVSTYGGAMRRRMLDGWHRMGDLHGRFRRALLLAGHDTRGADVFAAFLACGTLLKFGGGAMPDTFVARMVARFAPDNMTNAQEFRDPAESCLNRLLTSYNPEWHSGTQELIGEIVTAALQASHVPTDPSHTKLRRLGLAWREVDCGDAGTFQHLAVAYEWEALRKLFHASVWDHGGWKAALLKLPPHVMISGAVLGPRRSSEPIRFGRGSSSAATCRAVLIPVHIINRYLSTESADTPPAPPSAGWDGSASGGPLDGEGA